MKTPLLTTKLNIPPAHPQKILRPRLMERLQEGLGYNLILISAPAGFGKTTLLSEWLRQNASSLRAAWLSLDEKDNDPTGFWSYFISALRVLQPSCGETALALLHIDERFSGKPAPIESVLNALINDIAGIPGDFIVSLDDFHLIESKPIHDGITYLIEHIPAQMHLAIATRADPPLPLARFRARRIMQEIGADDLRFTTEDVVSLLKELKAPELSVEDIVALNERAEGWVAGLIMAILSMRGRKDITGFITDFAGSQRYVMDYLMEEVLQKQTPEVLGFLLKTSILESLTGPLCDVVTGYKNSQDILLNLERDHLFITPLDDTRQWYRYEHLFRDILHHRLQSEYGEETVRELHRLASGWHEGNDFPEKAVEHALAGQDWKRVIDLVMSMKPLVDYGGATIYNWLRQVPQDVLISHQVAYLFFIWSMVTIGQAKAGRDLLDAYENSAVFNDFTTGLAAGVRTSIASQLRDPRTDEYTRKAISLLPPDNVLGRMILSLQLGAHYMSTHRYNEAEPLLRESYKFFQQEGPASMANAALNWLTLITLLRGKLHEAEQMLKRKVKMAGRDINNTASNHLMLSIIYHAWDNLREAAAEREKAISLFPDPWILGSSYLYTSLRCLMQGDTDAAAEALVNADKLLITEDPAPEIIARVAAYHLALAIEKHDQEAISHWLDKLEEYKGSFLYDVPVSARHLLYEQRGDTGRKQLQAQYEQYHKEGYRYLEIIVRLHQVLMAAKADEALAFLADVLAMAKPEGNIRIITGFGMPMAPLLRRVIADGIEPDFARKALKIIEDEERQRKIRKGKTPSATDLLSKRELEVLKLMAEGSSNQQIAERLVISLSTAKNHVHNIIDKLEAKGRTQAVAQARELKLI